MLIVDGLSDVTRKNCKRQWSPYRLLTIAALSSLTYFVTRLKGVSLMQNICFAYRTVSCMISSLSIYLPGFDFDINSGEVSERYTASRE